MRLLVVSNRLPITVEEEEGSFVLQRSTGGLVSGLSAYLDSLAGSSFAKSDYAWVGWPGLTVKDEQKDRLRRLMFSETRSYPVFLTQETMEKFYHGFCNKTIWPLFHYFPSYASFDRGSWECYKLVNRIFCDAVVGMIKPDDVVWIHDYHLMLLPKLIRERKRSVPIGFFLHIPFPDFEIFRLLPVEWRTEILDGLLGSDFLGFHTHEYTQYFLRCVLRILGYDHNLGEIPTPERLTKADTVPMGIDFEKYSGAVTAPEVQQEQRQLRHELSGLKVIASVDRLDYSKGIHHRLQAYEIFLSRNPQWRGKVVLFLLVVPSRIGVDHYQELKRQIDEAVGRINGTYSTVGCPPILYKYGFLAFHPLVALYSISDIALVTPLRDGMNLVAKEFIAARPDRTGVLILSEMAGASKELGESIIINPNDVNEIAEALKTALEMPREEQVRRNEIMRSRLKEHDVARWANDFLAGLMEVKEKQKVYNARLLSFKTRGQLVRDFVRAERRLILIDYDGTLVPFVDDPRTAKPQRDLLNVLGRLCMDPRTDVVLISGRDRDTLGRWFGTLALGLVAEHGVWLKEKNADWRIMRPLASDWKRQIVSILQKYADRVPGAFVDEKEFSVVWHYRKCDPESGSARAKELAEDLIRFTANIDVQVLQGSRVIEVRNAGVNKGVAGLHWISKGGYGFVMAIGDDWTDEDLFKVLPESAYTIRVGFVSSYARFNLRDFKDVGRLIDKLAR